MLFLQAYTIVFAAALAWLNKIPCQKMMNYGASIKEEKEWHKVNAVVKLVWTLSWTLILVICKEPILYSLRCFVLLSLVQWTIFDIVLSKLLHRSFWYLGKTSAMDRRFRTFFGVQEGLWKFLICCIIIAAINLFL